jgi:hypothetical protein
MLMFGHTQYNIHEDHSSWHFDDLYTKEINCDEFKLQVLHQKSSVVSLKEYKFQQLLADMPKNLGN